MRDKAYLFYYALLVSPLFALCGDYYSDNIWEADKLGFVWMIRKYVDNSAKFYFLEKGRKKENATPFDIPSATYRRYPRYGTTMSVVKIHAINDKKALALAGIIDEIELDIWASRKSEKAKKIEADLRAIYTQEKNADTIIVKSSRYFDSVVDSL